MPLRDKLDEAVRHDAGELLERELSDVDELYVNGDLLVAVLVRVGLLLRDATRGPGVDVDFAVAAAAFLKAALPEWSGVPFGAGELLEWCEQAPVARLPVREAASRLVRGEDLTSQRLGLALARIAALGTVGGITLQRVGKTSGAGRWLIARGD